MKDIQIVLTMGTQMIYPKEGKMEFDIKNIEKTLADNNFLKKNKAL